MIEFVTERVNGLVAAIPQAQGAQPDVSGTLDLIAVIAVSALAILALQDLILVIFRWLVGLLKSMSHIVIDAGAEGVHIDLEAGDASEGGLPREPGDEPEEVDQEKSVTAGDARVDSLAAG